MGLFSLGFRGLLWFSKVKKTSRLLAKNKKKIQNKKQNERSTLLCFSAIFRSVLQFVYLKSLPTLFIYKKQCNQFEKTLRRKTTKHKPLKKENSFYYQTFKNLSAISISLLTSELPRQFWSFMHGYFSFMLLLNSLQHFIRMFLICCKEKLKRSKATLRFSFHFDFASTLFFLRQK